MEGDQEPTIGFFDWKCQQSHTGDCPTGQRLFRKKKKSQKNKAKVENRARAVKERGGRQEITVPNGGDVKHGATLGNFTTCIMRGVKQETQRKTKMSLQPHERQFKAHSKSITRLKGYTRLRHSLIRKKWTKNKTSVASFHRQINKVENLK